MYFMQMWLKPPVLSSKEVIFHIVDDETEEPIYRATVNIDGDKNYTKRDGNVIVELPIKDKYDITISKKGYTNSIIDDDVSGTVIVGLSKEE